MEDGRTEYTPEWYEINVEEEKDWYFTFGYGQEHGPNGYAKIFGTLSSSREEMIRRHGVKWSMQYDSAEKAGVERFNLYEVK